MWRRKRVRGVDESLEEEEEEGDDSRIKFLLRNSCVYIPLYL